jgi:hypothetical protein
MKQKQPEGQEEIEETDIELEKYSRQPEDCSFQQID